MRWKLASEGTIILKTLQTDLVLIDCPILQPLVSGAALGMDGQVSNGSGF